MADLVRRKVLRAGAATLAAAGLPACTTPTAKSNRPPNIVVLMTDQERYPAHWPADWAAMHLPGRQRLLRHGMTFDRAYTAASECSPSRAVMLTSQFAPKNQVAQTLLSPGLASAADLPNIGTLLEATAGYEVVWKGKWHLSYAVNAAAGNGGEAWTTADIDAFRERYGWRDWNPPDAGNAVAPVGMDPYGSFDGLATLGGGTPDNDGRYVHGVTHPGQTPGVGGGGVLDYLRDVAQRRERPFLLFVSLVNPHDIGYYPNGWQAGGYRHGDFANLGIALPPNYGDDLKTKPAVQLAYRTAYDAVAPLATLAAAIEYVNFYAYLHLVVDRHIVTILDALEEFNLARDTIVIRLADHGELGMSHGLREKSYTAYEEMIHIPFIVSNPVLFREPQATDAFYSHLDLLPTLADLAGVPPERRPGRGTSIVPVLRNPRASVQDSVLYSYDDVFRLPADTRGAHIRALREGDWTYAVYFGMDGRGLAYELYDLANDPGQLINLVAGDPPLPVRREWDRLHAKLTAKLDAAANRPAGFAWPERPGRSPV